uniref:Transmembrane 6 superfamily member 1 n=1 Tax=Oncorhynchus kisutch TaxID=8019 RepID=A0A8C7J7Y8_ONCKI
MRVDSVNRAMHASAGTGVFILSLTSIPISFFFNSLIYTNSIETVFFAGSTTVLILAISACFLFKKKAPKDPLFYVFAVYAFLSVVNLIIGLEQDSIIDGFITFYLKNGKLQSHRPVLGGVHSHARHRLHSWKCCGWVLSNEWIKLDRYFIEHAWLICFIPEHNANQSQHRSSEIYPCTQTEHVLSILREEHYFHTCFLISPHQGSMVPS